MIRTLVFLFCLFIPLTWLSAEDTAKTEKKAAASTAAASGAAQSSAATSSAAATASSSSLTSDTSPLVSSAQPSSSGSFQWSYPINIPAGTNGVQPSLALVYNSAAPNGILGMGFSLTGFSTIERDMSRGGINFNSADDYLLDGQKLYLDAVDTTNKLFHTERESFDKIQAFTGSTTSGTVTVDPNAYDSYWIVSKKDGTKLYYGQTADSRIPAIGKTDTSAHPLTRVWALNRVEDALGNYYAIQYDQDASGAYYPRSVLYTKNDQSGKALAQWNQVQFTYEPRTDHWPMYLPTKVDVTRRLTWVSVISAAGSGPQLVRKYRLNYDPAQTTGVRSHLVSIQEFGNDGGIPSQGVASYVPSVSEKRLPSVGLKWDSAVATGLVPAAANYGQVIWTNEDRTFLGDVNGDGKQDLVVIRSVNVGVGGPGIVYTYFAGINGFDGGSASNGQVLWTNEDRTFLADVNGDGKQDLVVIRSVNVNVGGPGIVYTYLAGTNGFDGGSASNGQLLWTNEDRAFPADVNGDGKQDLVVIRSVNVNVGGPGIVYTYLAGTNGFDGGSASNGQLLWTNEDRAFPADVNGDGKQDLVVIRSVSVNVGGPGIVYTYLAGTNGFDGGSASNGQLLWTNQDRAFPADVNGDGKQDLVIIRSVNANVGGPGIVYTYLAGTNGFGGGSSVNGQALWTNEDRAFPADVNGDGKQDLVIIRSANVNVGGPGIVYTCLAGTNGFDGGSIASGQVISTNSDQAFSTDLDHDGMQDLMVIRSINAGGPGIAYGYIASYPREMLNRVDLSAGGSVSATYTPAPQLPSLAGMSGPIQPTLSAYPKVANTSSRLLVTKIVADSGIPGVAPISTSFQYFNGQYLSGSSEDRTDLGFRTMTKIDDNTGTKTITTFSQNTPTQGLALGKLTTDSSGNKYSELINTYGITNNANLAKVKFIFPASTQQNVFDGQTTSVGTKVTFDLYDAAGNLLQKTSLGFAINGIDQSNQDNVREVYTYGSSNTRFLTRLTKKQTYSYDDAASPTEGLASETRYYYDGSSTLGSIGIGQLTQVESRIDSSTTASSTNEYDAWGNIIKTTDAAGIISFQRTYDSAYHSLLASSTDAAGLTTTYGYAGLLPSSTTDSQGNTSRVFYDAFGRPISNVSALPRDSELSPTAKRTYSDTATLPVTPTFVINEEKTTGTTYLPSYSYFDGLGRVIQTKALAKVGGQYVTVDHYYDASGRQYAFSNPYLSPNAAFSYSLSNYDTQKKTVSVFDAVGRVVQTTNPDGTYSRTEYLRNITRTIDALNHVTEVEDRGNVRYQRTYTGIYSLRALYTTVTITTSRGKTVIEDDKDNDLATQGNKIITLFDMTGRKTQYTAPDMGTWAYEYFANGSLKKQTDAKGNVLNFTYDAAGRVATKSQGSTVVATYGYGITGYQKGRLETIRLGDASSAIYLSYTYDQLGRATAISKTIGAFGTNAVNLSYNADGRLATKQFPGNSETVSYTYSPEGILQNLQGTDTYLSSISMDDFGRVCVQAWGNGTTTTRAFDPVTFRTTDLVTPGVMNLHYTFDAIGQVLTKTDNFLSSASESYTYDDLNRLQFASGIYGTRGYQYDTLNNLLGQNGIAVNSYSGLGPHAISGDGTYTYAYDANGNMTVRQLSSATDRSYVYDAENRLTSAVVSGITTGYTYDDTRQRTTMTIGTKTTVFWFEGYEEIYTTGTLTETIRSYHVNGQTVAQRSSISGLVFVYTDHLGSTSKVRDSSGTITASYYEPFGKLYSTTINGVRQAFTGQDWDASADLYYYNARYYSATLGRFVQVDPGIYSMEAQQRDPDLAKSLSLSELMNPYTYGNNSPVIFVDPTGLWSFLGIINWGEDSATGGLDINLGVASISVGPKGVTATAANALLGMIPGFQFLLADPFGVVGAGIIWSGPTQGLYGSYSTYGWRVEAGLMNGSIKVGGALGAFGIYPVGAGFSIGHEYSFEYYDIFNVIQVDESGHTIYNTFEGGVSVRDGKVTNIESGRWLAGGLFGGKGWTGGRIDGEPGNQIWPVPRSPLDTIWRNHDRWWEPGGNGIGDGFLNDLNMIASTAIQVALYAKLSSIVALLGW